jgi:hypothetical protein
MRDLFLGLGEFGGDFLEEADHGLFAVEDGACFFIAGNEVLHLLLEVLVDALVLQNGHETLVDLVVYELVLAYQITVLFS